MSSSSANSPPVSPAAWLSLALGLSSFLLCLLGLTGLPAAIVGLRAVRAINTSDGQLGGVRIALAGLILGTCSSLLTAAGLLAILLVKLQAANQRMECSDHLRQLGLALNRYADDRGAFPPATRTPVSAPPADRLGWIAETLPFVGEGTRMEAVYRKIFQSISLEHTWQDPANASARQARLRLLHCPGQPGSLDNTTSYVGVSGVGLDAINRKRDQPGAGMFGNDRGVRRNEVHDGISFTLLVLETGHDPGPWLAGGWPTVRGLNPQVDIYGGPGRPFGGLHTGITQALWVDGSVRPLADSTPADLFRSHATLRDD
ncbi:MAG: DUF1559 domain-containing protein [Gemmataceae bacterium]